MIPHIFHWIWLGGKPIATEHLGFILGWIRMHPGWQVMLWQDDNLPVLQNKEIYNATKCHGHRGDLVRYQVIYDFGGIYLDTDFECLEKIDPYLDREVLLAKEQSDSICTAMIGAVPKHPFFKTLLDNQLEFMRHGGIATDQTGPRYLTAMYERWKPKFPIVENPRIFYPFNWGQPRNMRWPETIAAHHWAGQWSKPK